MTTDLDPPLLVIAELTHRCPLRCGYCSNPRALLGRAAELDTRTWIRTLEQAAELGVVAVHFTGGEPLLRDDLDALIGAAVELGLYSTLITSGLGGALPAAGLRAVQVSFQDTNAAAAAAVAGRDALARKLEFARQVRARGLSLTCNFVLHVGNLTRCQEFIELALELGADRIELAHVQMHGWAAINREPLLPTRAQLDAVSAVINLARLRLFGAIELLHVLPDLHRERPGACMGGWGTRAIVVDPEGTALPCHGARSLPIHLPNVRESTLAEIWSGPAFSRFRGEEWMEDPCRSCPERGRDRGGCRCRAWEITGRATATDPACRHAPDHPTVLAWRRQAEQEQVAPRRLQLRTLGS